MIWLICFGVTVREILRVEIPEKLLSQQKKLKTVFSTVDILLQED